MFTGTGTALVTPFEGDGSLDESRCAGSSSGRSKLALIFWCHAERQAKALLLRMKNISVLWKLRWQRPRAEFPFWREPGATTRQT